MHIHIMGVAGTFMAGLARIAKDMGLQVTGSEQATIYPPMSTQLAADGILVQAPYAAENLKIKPDLVVVGNAIKRGNPELEYVLNEGIPYVSGPQWLAEHCLSGRHVIAVSGTHGKTTTTTMIAHMLQDNGIDCGYLIGGVPQNLPGSAHLGSAPYFVIEADEYDSAFFDKRSKFIHYHPETLIINNIEFDHADIFDTLKDIQKQFHHCVRTVPSKGCIIVPAHEPVITEVLDMGCWTPVQTVSTDHADKDSQTLLASALSADGSHFNIMQNGKILGEVSWSLTGHHNMMNALVSIAAAARTGLSMDKILSSLSRFKTPKRRMEVIAETQGITVFDDFAHHPTAIETTLAGLRAKVGKARIIVLLEMRSYTMRTGSHGQKMMDALHEANRVYLLKPEMLTDEAIAALTQAHADCAVYPSADKIIDALLPEITAGDQVVLMSNGAFDAMREKLPKRLNHELA